MAILTLSKIILPVTGLILLAGLSLTAAGCKTLSDSRLKIDGGQSIDGQALN